MGAGGWLGTGGWGLVAGDWGHGNRGLGGKSLGVSRELRGAAFRAEVVHLPLVLHLAGSARRIDGHPADRIENGGHHSLPVRGAPPPCADDLALEPWLSRPANASMIGHAGA